MKNLRILRALYGYATVKSTEVDKPVDHVCSSQSVSRLTTI